MDLQSLTNDQLTEIAAQSTAELGRRLLLSQLAAIPALPEEPLSADEACRMIGKSRRWLFGHAKELPFVRRVSRKTIVCDPVVLRRWLANRR